jgi:hypothetical protein
MVSSLITAGGGPHGCQHVGVLGVALACWPGITSWRGLGTLGMRTAAPAAWSDRAQLLLVGGWLP